ncbi:fanconi anemia group F protein (FANCF) isoform X2 [Wolffia australiana]
MSPSDSSLSFENISKLINGFVDILILASGHCSSGASASWDAENVGKAIKWGAFFEEVFNYLNQSNEGRVLIEELDAFLQELTSNDYFPRGLRGLSSESLSTARNGVLKFFSQSLYLSNVLLRALLSTCIKADQELLTEAAFNLSFYFERSMQVKAFTENSVVTNFIGCPSWPLKNTHAMNTKRQCSDFVFEELGERLAFMSCLSSCETTLDTLKEVILRNNFDGNEFDIFPAKSRDTNLNLEGDRLARFLLWNSWKQKNLTYLLSQRTMRLLSGSRLIFNAPKAQWAKIFDSLMSSTEANDASFLEIVEICLLGFISSRWTQKLEHFISFSCDFLPVREQYFGALNSFQEVPTKNTINLKEEEILEFCTSLLVKKLIKLWELPPVLVAAALPRWSSLFRSHVGDLGKELQGDCDSPRCTCNKGGDCHCELAERIWCFHAFCLPEGDGSA